VQGIYGMLQLWMQESLSRDKSRPLQLIGILPNMFKQTRLHKDILNSLQDSPTIGKYVLPVKFSQRIVFAEVDAADSSPRSIFDYPEQHVAKTEAEEVCSHIAERIFA